MFSLVLNGVVSTPFNMEQTRMLFNPEAIRKFWALVDVRNEDDCWIWKGGKGSKGYGAVNLDGMSMRAHRASVMITTGKPIPTGMIILHSCDRPACVNPRHLSIGTDAENMADKLSKNRQARLRGESAGLHKLTDALVKQLLWDRMDGMSFHGLSRKYLLDKKTVTMICTGASWAHIHGGEGAPTLAQVLNVPKERRSGAIMNEETVSIIMQRLAKGEPAKPLAKEFGVHFATVSDIKNGKCWTELAGINGNPTVHEMQTAYPQSKFTAKMTEEMAVDAKRRLKLGETAKSIARSMGLSAGAIDAIKQGRTWGHLP
jgi:hypothetical protein